MAAKKEPTTDVAEVNLDDAKVFVREAKGIDFVPQSWDEIEAAFAQEGGILTFEGSPYYVIDKEKLLDVPFMIVDVRVWESDKYGRDACSVMIMTKESINVGVNPMTGEKDERNLFVFNDGSTGIFEQVTGMVKRSGRKGGILCPNGLRKSEYKYDQYDAFDDKHTLIDASTYYVQ